MEESNISDDAPEQVISREARDLQNSFRELLGSCDCKELNVSREVVERTIDELERLRQKIEELLSHIASIPTEEFDAMIVSIDQEDDED